MLACLWMNSVKTKNSGTLNCNKRLELLLSCAINITFILVFYFWSSAKFFNSRFWKISLLYYITKYVFLQIRKIKKTVFYSYIKKSALLHGVIFASGISNSRCMLFPTTQNPEESLVSVRRARHQGLWTAGFPLSDNEKYHNDCLLCLPFPIWKAECLPAGWWLKSRKNGPWWAVSIFNISYIVGNGLRREEEKVCTNCVAGA